MSLLDLFCHSREARRRLEEQRLRLYRTAYAWTHHAALADDLVQEAMAKAIQSCRQLRDPDACRAWLYRILANCYYDHFRRRREMDQIDEETVATETTPEDESGQLEVVREVRAAIALLPEGQRQVVTLVDIEGCSYVEVAQILGVPIGTVMSRLCRARGALRGPLAHIAPRASVTSATVRRIK